MRKLISTLAGVLLVAGIVAAQGHDNMTEKKVTSELNFSNPVRVGNVTLPAGDYKVVCDRTTIAFMPKNSDKHLLEAPCKGKELEKKAEVTTAATSIDKNGVRHLDKLTIRGSNVEHIFN